MRGGTWVGIASCLLAWGCSGAPEPARASPLALTLLHTSDIHSHLWPIRKRISAFEAELGLGEPGVLTEVGGAARLATLLRNERARSPSIWLDSGDALEGAEIFTRFGGRVELELLSGLGLSAMALGNHELSLSSSELAALFIESARFPVLVSNLRPHVGSALAGLLEPSVALDVQGTRLVLIGVSNQQSPPDLAAINNPWGLESAPDVALAVQAAIDDASTQGGLVVVLSHLGLEQDRALVQATSGIDLVLGGHEHLVTAEPEWQLDCSGGQIVAERGCSSRRVPIIHSGAYAQWLSRLELQLSPDLANEGQLEIRSLALNQLPVTAAVAEDANVAAYLNERWPGPEPPLAFAPQPLARRAALGGDSPLGNLTADAARLNGSADVAILNTSGIRADLEAGPIVSADLELAFPFEEPWRLAWVTGWALRRGLERVARRSAEHSCSAALQVSGLRLKIHCRACLVEGGECLEIARATDTADRLEDAEQLLVVLPSYLTRDGADFAELGASGTELPGTVAAWIARLAGARPRGTAMAACATSLRDWSESRCVDAFGPTVCPLDAAHRLEVCGDLPELKGARDDRIQMLP